MDYYFLLFIKSLLAGLIISAPLGPIGIVTVRYAFMHKGLSKLAAATGMITADFIYASLFLFNHRLIPAILKTIPSHQLAIHLGLGLFICLLGIKLIFQKHVKSKAEKKILQSQHAFWATMSFALLNPLNFLGFFVIMTFFGLIKPDLSWKSRIVILLGMTTGALAWWPLILKWIESVQKSQSEIDHTLINRITGTILILLGIYYLLNKPFFPW